MEANAHHYTNASFHKEYIPLEKICGTSDKPQQPKQPREKKQKTSRKPKKPKKPRVSGKGFGGHFSQIPWFFWFLWFFWFSRVFCFFWFSWVLFFVFFGFLNFQTISQKRFFDLLPYGLFIADVAQTAPFPQNFAHAAPQHVCLFFPKQTAILYPYYLAKVCLSNMNKCLLYSIIALGR